MKLIFRNSFKKCSKCNTNYTTSKITQYHVLDQKEFKKTPKKFTRNNTPRHYFAN